MNLSLIALFLYEKRKVRKLIYCFYGNTNKNFISTVSINFFKQCLKYNVVCGEKQMGLLGDF